MGNAQTCILDKIIKFCALRKKNQNDKSSCLNQTQYIRITIKHLLNSAKDNKNNSRNDLNHLVQTSVDGPALRRRGH